MRHLSVGADGGIYRIPRVFAALIVISSRHVRVAETHTEAVLESLHQ